MLEEYVLGEINNENVLPVIRTLELSTKEYIYSFITHKTTDKKLVSFSGNLETTVLAAAGLSSEYANYDKSVLTFKLSKESSDQDTYSITAKRLIKGDNDGDGKIEDTEHKIGVTSGPAEYTILSTDEEKKKSKLFTITPNNNNLLKNKLFSGVWYSMKPKGGPDDGKLELFHFLDETDAANKKLYNPADTHYSYLPDDKNKKESETHLSEVMFFPLEGVMSGGSTDISGTSMTVAGMVKRLGMIMKKTVPDDAKQQNCDKYITSSSGSKNCLWTGKIGVKPGFMYCKLNEVCGKNGCYGNTDNDKNLCVRNPKTFVIEQKVPDEPDDKKPDNNNSDEKKSSKSKCSWFTDYMWLFIIIGVFFLMGIVFLVMRCNSRGVMTCRTTKPSEVICASSGAVSSQGSGASVIAVNREGSGGSGGMC